MSASAIPASVVVLPCDARARDVMRDARSDGEPDVERDAVCDGMRDAARDVRRASPSTATW